jgi:hypothetical protein
MPSPGKNSDRFCQWFSDFSSALPTWRRILEKLIVVELVEKFPTYYGTLKPIAMLTRAHLA